jgi:phospholipid/cholesterol/gamma-HCH transport system ATP-binding protein
MKPARPPSPAPPLLETRALCVQFDRQPVLRDVDLAIPRGQTLAIIGESGCGKTVLIKALIGLIRPTSGSVWFDGRELARLSDKELSQERARYGFVFQQAALFDSMTVADNVAFPLRQHTHKSDDEIDEMVMARLRDVGLPPTVLGKRPAQLSGGMRKRVGLARALALDPELILYDEPTTGLDPIMSDVINELILRARQGKTVTSIVVTHDMHSARKVAERIVMVHPLPRLSPHEAQVVFDGTPAALEASRDPRVSQFVRGEARERLMELATQ